MRQHIDREMLREWGIYWSKEDIAKHVPKAGVSMSDLLDSDLIPNDKVWVAVHAMTEEERQTFAKGCATRAQGYAARSDRAAHYADRAQGYATSASAHASAWVSTLAAHAARSAVASAAFYAALAASAADAEREAQLTLIKGLIK